MNEEKYLKSEGNICLFCQSKNINTLSKIEVQDDGVAIECIECYDCGGTWKNVYKLSGVIVDFEISTEDLLKENKILHSYFKKLVKLSNEHKEPGSYSSGSDPESVAGVKFLQEAYTVSKKYKKCFNK